MWEAQIRGSQSSLDWAKMENPILIITKAKRVVGMALVPTKQTNKQTKKEGKKERKKEENKEIRAMTIKVC
jgi:hypothetical protein